MVNQNEGSKKVQLFCFFFLVRKSEHAWNKPTACILKGDIISFDLKSFDIIFLYTSVNSQNIIFGKLVEK